MACTTILVGKNASYDGSTIIARNDDSGAGDWTPKKFVVVQPEDQPRHYRSVLSHVEIELPEKPMRYTTLPNAVAGEGIWPAAGVNTENVAMTATETITSNPRVLAADPLVTFKAAKGTEGEEGYEPEVVGGIGEEDIVTLVLPYIRSAREGVERLGKLLETYGTYEMNGIAFSDTNEIWWLETIGGHHWMARRVPDACYVVMPNQLGIDYFNLEDAEGKKENFMASVDLRSWMDEHHLDLTMREPADASADTFNPRLAFGSHDPSDHIYNTPRAWYMLRSLNPRSYTWDGPNAEYGPEDDDLPWCLVPERKITMEDVKDLLSSHFQGTVYDPYGRHTKDPMYRAYRPIGINRTSLLCTIQLRPYVPKAAQAIEWISFGSNAFNASVPFFANVNRTPEYLANTTDEVTSDSFYWANRLIAALADAHYASTQSPVERYCLKVPSLGHNLVDLYTAKVQSETLSYTAATDVLEQANDEMARLLKQETQQLLAEVLEAASNEMKNGFARSDA